MADKEGCFPVQFKAHFLRALSSFALHQAEPPDRMNKQPGCSLVGGSCCEVSGPGRAEVAGAHRAELGLQVRRPCPTRPGADGQSSRGCSQSAAAEHQRGSVLRATSDASCVCSGAADAAILPCLHPS